MRRCCPIKGVPSAVTSEPSAFILKHKRNYLHAPIPETFTMTRENVRGVTEPYGLVRNGSRSFRREAREVEEDVGEVRKGVG